MAASSSAKIMTSFRSIVRVLPQKSLILTIESLGSVVFDKRNRWIAIVVMSVAALAFVGLSIILPLTGALRNNSQTVASTPSPGTSPQEDLEAQARGYELVLQREPDNQTALRGLLDVRVQQGDVEGALVPLEKLAELNPEQTDYAVLLGQVKQRQGDREGAAQAFRNVLATRPGNINALQGLVDLLLEEQRPQQAAQLLQDTLKTADEANSLQPGSIDVVSVELLLARVYAEQARYPDAIEIYDNAIAQADQDFRPLLGKAIVLQTQGKDDEAKPLFEQAKELAPAQFKDQIELIASGKTPVFAGPTPTTESSPSPDAATSP